MSVESAQPLGDWCAEERSGLVTAIALPCATFIFAFVCDVPASGIVCLRESFL